MKLRSLTFVLILIFLFSSTACAESAGVNTSTETDQTAMEVTVYNSNLGLVKDVRAIDLGTGEGELRFMDVASGIIPETVHVKSVNRPEAFAVYEQNYEYDLISPDKLLDKYVGKDVKLIEFNEYQDKKEIVQGTLLSNNGGQVYRINGEIYLGYPGYKILPEIPENLIAKPTLMWLYNNTGAKSHTLELSYLTNSINWKADYVMVLDAKDTSSDISGWVTVDNRSGATYRDAKLKLVAGDIHRAPEPMYRGAVEKMMMAAQAPMFEEKAFFEYHIYDLARKTTIKDRQSKQISFLEASDVRIGKEYLTYGRNNSYASAYPGQKQKQPVNVFIRFENSAKNNLGMPLPAGIMRMYKADSDGSLQFVGEDRIDHTPKDEKVELEAGEAFDIVAEKTQTDFKQTVTKMYETEWEITLRNHKDEDITVGVIEQLTGSWKILAKSHQYKEMDANTIRFDVKVPKNKEVIVSYRVRVQFGG